MGEKLFGARKVSLLVATLFVGLATTGCGSDATAQAIASFDPAEVQMLRDQAEDQGMEVDDELLLSTLQFREDCRTIADGLGRLAAGDSAEEVADDLVGLVDSTVEQGQADMADYYRQVVDEVRLGDSSNLQEFHENSCADVT